MELTISQLQDFLRCPAYYEFRYIDGIVLPRSAASLQGHCVRFGVQSNYRQKLTSYEDMPIAELEDRVADEFDREALEVEWQDGEDREEIKDETLALIGIYLRNLAPSIQPLFVDSHYALEISGTNLITIKGCIKLIDEDVILRDTKTSGRSPAADDIAKNLKLTADAFAYRKLTGRVEGGVALDYLVRTKQPKLVSVTAVKTQIDMERLCSIIVCVAAAIQRGEFYPNPSQLYCSKKYCGYWDECHARFRKSA